MWMDSARSASHSSSVVFPGAPDLIVSSEPSSLSSLLLVEGAGVHGARGGSTGDGCPSICPCVAVVCTSSSKISLQ